MADAAQTPVALTIAGSDSSGGAGIQADLKTFTALGVYGASVLTALTAQNTRGVTAILPVPAAFVTQQIDAVASDLRIAAVKTGMLNDRATVLAVVAGVRRHTLRPLVVDPVMVATSGDMLLQPDAVEAVRRDLLPLADIITPNLAGGGAAARSTRRRRRAGDGGAGAGAAGARAQGGAAQGWARQGERCGRHPGHTRCRAAASGVAAHRHSQHARHGVHAIGRHCRRPGARRVAARTRLRRQSASSMPP